MNRIRLRLAPSFLFAPAVAVAACNALTGVDELEVVLSSGSGGGHDASIDADASAGMGGAAGADAAAGGAGGAGAGGTAGSGPDDGGGGAAGKDASQDAVDSGAGGSAGAAGQDGSVADAGAGGDAGGAAGQAGSAGADAGCEAGTTWCSGSCVNLDTDAENCGGCGNVCQLNHAAAQCVAGACQFACASGWAACDGLPLNGCETPIDTVFHCGDCLTSCTNPPHATAACVAGACGIGACDATYEDCDEDPANGCESQPLTDLSNCGACGKPCVPVNATGAACAAGACSFTCDGTFMDCDGKAGNGCEVDVKFDGNHCNGCGAACPMHVFCDNGVCQAGGCARGWRDCDGSPANGCELECGAGCKDDHTCATIVAVGAGGAHSCALLSSKTLLCWGAGDRGQLGDGSSGSTHSWSVTERILNEGVDDVSLGFKHTCILSSGAVKCWGYNGMGQLGNGSLVDNPSALFPTEAVASGAKKVVTGASNTTCAIMINNHVLCWGEHFTPSPTEVADLSDVSAMGVGTAHVCATTSVDVKCWGDNTHGQLGTGAGSASAPTTVIGSSGAWTLLAGGDRHTLAATGGAAYGFGLNTDGQLGLGDVTAHTTPDKIDSLTAAFGTTVVALGAGARHSCALVHGTNGKTRPVCWGSNDAGQIGPKGPVSGIRTTPVDVTQEGAVMSVTKLAVGWAHNCVVLEGDQQIACWGQGTSGELGNGVQSSISEPQQVIIVY